MQFNEILKDLRTEYGYTQIQLAQKAKLATSCIAMLETNKREPAAHTLIALAKALNVSTDYLLGLEDDYSTQIIPAEHIKPYVDLSFSSEERKLIELYRSLPEKLRQVAYNQLEILSGANESLPKPHKKV